MLNNQDFMELRWRNDVGSLAVKDQGISEKPETDGDRLINGLKLSYDYFDHDQTDVHLQIVPEIHKEEEKSKQDLLVVVPDEHSETGDHHHIKDYSDNRWYLKNKHDKPKRRRIPILSDDESDGFTREVPNSVTRRGSKRRRIDEMSDKIRTIQKLVPNCDKTDEVWVLDKAIEYMKTLQLQLQVMSIMGMNSYFPPATFDFGMHNRMMTAMAVAQTASSPLFPASNWPVSSPQRLYGLVPYFPSFLDFPSHTMGRL